MQQMRFLLMLLLTVATFAAIAGGCAKKTVRKEAKAKDGAVTFTDSRDSKKYRTVKVGNLTWMAENLNFKTKSSVCYGNNESNCKKYGQLYNLDDATKACPAGWRVPSDKDWNNLAVAVGGKSKGDGAWEDAGAMLRSKIGWDGWKNDDGKALLGDGIDKFGFSALPGGCGGEGNDFYDAGEYACWWSITTCGTKCSSYQHMYYSEGENLYRYYGNYKTSLFSLRCVK